MVEHQLPKLTVRVRFPSPAPHAKSVAGQANREPSPVWRAPVGVANRLPCHYRAITPTWQALQPQSSSSSSGLVVIDPAGLASALVAASTISLMAAAMARSASAFKSLKSRLVRSFCTGLKPPASPTAARLPGGHAASGRSRPYAAPQRLQGAPIPTGACRSSCKPLGDEGEGSAQPLSARPPGRRLFPGTGREPARCSWEPDSGCRLSPLEMLGQDQPPRLPRSRCAPGPAQLTATLSSRREWLRQQF